MYHVSLSTVQRAIALLNARGLIRGIPGDGLYYVSDNVDPRTAVVVIRPGKSGQTYRGANEPWLTSAGRLCPAGSAAARLLIHGGPDGVADRRCDGTVWVAAV